MNAADLRELFPIHHLSYPFQQIGKDSRLTTLPLAGASTNPEPCALHSPECGYYLIDCLAFSLTAFDSVGEVANLLGYLSQA